MKNSLKLLMICIASFSTALAQTDEPAAGDERVRSYEEQSAGALEAERARLANQRIRTESELRAREEQRRLEEAEQQRLREQGEAKEGDDSFVPGADVKPTDSADRADLSRTLKQLRSLGELKDDGYITEEEFQKIKKKILDGQI